MSVETLSCTTTTLKRCPAFVLGQDGLPEACGLPLEVVAHTDIVGDDYGSWPTFDVYLRCGHTLADIEAGLKHRDEV